MTTAAVQKKRGKGKKKNYADHTEKKNILEKQKKQGVLALGHLHFVKKEMEGEGCCGQRLLMTCLFAALELHAMVTENIYIYI